MIRMQYTKPTVKSYGDVADVTLTDARLFSASVSGKKSYSSIVRKERGKRRGIEKRPPWAGGDDD